MLGLGNLAASAPGMISQPPPPALPVLENKEWRFRPPPWGLACEGFRLCSRIVAGVPCRLGEQCSNAHSQEELREWQLQSSVRQKMMQAHSKEGSYINSLLQYISQVESIDDIFHDSLPFARARNSSEREVYVARDAAHHWTLTITSVQVPVQWVSLIDDSSHSEFSLAGVITWSGGRKKEYAISPPCHEWRNPATTKEPPVGELTYVVKVSFSSGVFGTFTQTVVFDFGHRPLLVQHLKVEVVPDPTAVERLDVEEDLVCKDRRWDQRNSFMVSFKPLSTVSNVADELLMARYPPPTTKVTGKAHVLSHPLTPETYRQRLHLLLSAEEWDQRELLSRYNFETELQLVESYWLTGLVTTTKFCVPGELFAQLSLHRRLTEDTAAGRIILTSCSSVLLSPCKSPITYRGKRKVFEALIEGKCKDIIYLRLSAACVSELKLSSSTVMKAEIQFQLDRLQLCELHHAVDALPDVKLVFPQADKLPNSSWMPLKHLETELDSRLNAKQQEAIMLMMAPTAAQLPPILLMGPYGTGKTFTLAQGIKTLLQHTTARILVCTHSNSAADLYVKDYLHPFVKAGMEEAAPLRIYYKHRRVETVNHTVLSYCLLETEGPNKVFRKPTAKDVLEKRVIIVTLATSRSLTELDLPPGYFTHVILDEAAQVMECEAILPFALISGVTRIVLAGDHMQLSPEVHSLLARQHGLQVSLLERLYDSYPPVHPCAVLLRENYRSHPAIVHFTSKLFYQNQLKATACIPPHPTIYPLSFFTAKGHEVQDYNSTAFYNNAEVYEVVDRVTELRQTWPEAWGPLDDSSIGVVSPYADQVFQLRGALRQKKLGNVSVERVLNIQGKQFRIIILSTVRTRHTCARRDDPDSGEKKSPSTKQKQGDRPETTPEDDEEKDFGFLSNAKLLVTAITRAQSVVAVVGDPVALCSVGKCRKLWEIYLETCERNKSLKGTSYRRVCVELGNLEVGISSSLDPKAPVFVPRSLPLDMPPHSYTYHPAARPNLLPFHLVVPMMGSATTTTTPFKFSGSSALGHLRGYVDGGPRLPMLTEGSTNGLRVPLAVQQMLEERRRELEEVRRKAEAMRGGGCPNGRTFWSAAAIETDGENPQRHHQPLQQLLQHHHHHNHPVEDGYASSTNLRRLEAAEAALLPPQPPSAMSNERYRFFGLGAPPPPPPPLPLPRFPDEDHEKRLKQKPAEVMNDWLDAAPPQPRRSLVGPVPGPLSILLHHQADAAGFQRVLNHHQTLTQPVVSTNASQCLLSYAEAVRTSAMPLGPSPVSVVDEFQQRVAPRTSNGLYKYF